MKLTQDEIIQRWQAFNIHYNRIQEIKRLADEMDKDGDFDDLDFMQMQMNDFMKEINYLYNSCMLPMLSEIVQHINEYDELINQIITEEKYGDVKILTDNAEKLLIEKENEIKAADVSRIVKELMKDKPEEAKAIEESQETLKSDDEEISFELSEENKMLTDKIRKRIKEKDEETAKQIEAEINSLTKRFKRKKQKERKALAEQPVEEIKQDAAEKTDAAPTDQESILDELG
jgi:hypothetical protein